MGNESHITFSFNDFNSDNQNLFLSEFEDMLVGVSEFFNEKMLFQMEEKIRLKKKP